MNQQIITEPEFKKLEQRLKYDWFLLKLYSMFQELSRRSIETGFWLKKFLIRTQNIQTQVCFLSLGCKF